MLASYSCMAIGQEIYVQNFNSPDSQSSISTKFESHSKTEGQFGVLQGSRILLLPRFVQGRKSPSPYAGNGSGTRVRPAGLDAGAPYLEFGPILCRVPDLQ